MKAGALNDGGAGLVYRGSLVFRRDSLGVLSFESAPIAAGRITAVGVRYHVTDHLGSVRGVSPYAYCAGDPVNAVDVDGFSWVVGGVNAGVDFVVQVGVNRLSEAVNDSTKSPS